MRCRCVCAAVPPLVSGGGPLSDCSLPHLHGRDSAQPQLYVNLSLVGGLGSGDEVVCRTDLGPCCHRDAGPDRGDWYFPDGDRLPFPGNHPLVQNRQTQRVELVRLAGSGSTPSGIYRCDIETRAVHSDDNTARETVYVGLYDSGGDKTIIIIIHSDMYCKLYTACVYALRL